MHPSMFTHHVWFRLLSPAVTGLLSRLDLTASYHDGARGRVTHPHQNPRCAPKPCIPQCLHMVFGSDYYSISPNHSYHGTVQQSEPTMKQKSPCIVRQCLHTVFGSDYSAIPPNNSCIRMAHKCLANHFLEYLVPGES